MADLTFVLTDGSKWAVGILLELGLLIWLLWAMMAGRGPRWLYEDIEDGEEERE